VSRVELVPAHALRRGPASGDRPSPSLRALAAKGYRPFFLLAAAFAALVVPLWLLALLRVVNPDGYLGATIWHVHEMVFGFASAVIAGFLLTAVSTWTGRETLTGAPLLALAGLWVAGRVVLLAGLAVPAPLAAGIDLAFLPALAVAIGVPLVRTRNRRNFFALAVVGALFAVNLAMHLDVLGVLGGVRRRALLVGVDVVILLLAVIAGRVLPMFTRNATGAKDVRSHPSLDAAALAALTALTLLDAAAPQARVVPWLAGVAGALAAARAVHWGAWHARRAPLLWILHAGWAWVVVGLLLRAAPAIGLPAGESLATHALTVGAIGATTLGMMARVALGHGGHPLAAPRYAPVAFAMILLAAAVRVLLPLVWPGTYDGAIFGAGLAWTAAFVLYLVDYVPILATPRSDGQPG